MAETAEAKQFMETNERTQPDARDRSTLHAAADQTSQDARQTSEQGAEAAKRGAEAAADAASRTTEVAADMTRRAAVQSNEGAMSSLRALAGAQAPLADIGFDQSQRALEITMHVSGVFREGAERAADDLNALIGSWANLGRGLQRWQHAYYEQLQRSMASFARRRQDLLRSNSPVEFAKVQRDLYVDFVRNTLSSNTALLQLAGQIAEEAARPLQQRSHA